MIDDYIYRQLKEIHQQIRFPFDVPEKTFKTVKLLFRGEAKLRFKAKEFGHLYFFVGQLNNCMIRL